MHAETHSIFFKFQSLSLDDEIARDSKRKSDHKYYKNVLCILHGISCCVLFCNLCVVEIDSYLLRLKPKYTTDHILNFSETHAYFMATRIKFGPQIKIWWKKTILAFAFVFIALNEWFTSKCRLPFIIVFFSVFFSAKCVYIISLITATDFHEAYSN